MEAIHKNILATIAYYDAQRYPLTTFEVWKHYFQSIAPQSISFYQVFDCLQQLKEKRYIVQVHGMWALKDHEHYVNGRLVKQKIAIRKIRQSAFWARCIAWVPFLRGLIVTGTMAMKNTTIHSDWDVIVVVRQGRIWIGRLFVTAILHLLGKRRHGDRMENRFCLNHFVTEGGLLLDEQNEFSAKELHFSTVLLGPQIHRVFVQENMTWMQSIIPHVSVPKLQSPITVDNDQITRNIRKGLEWILDFSGIASLVNAVSRYVMVRKIKQNPNTYVPGADIRYSEQALVFLPQPRRAAIREEMYCQLTKLPH